MVMPLRRQIGERRISQLPMIYDLMALGILKHLLHKLGVMCAKKTRVTFVRNATCDFIQIRVQFVLG